MKRHITIPVMLSIFAVPVFADSITFTGLVKTELPNVNLLISDAPVADVKEFTLSPTNNAGICNLQHSKSQAKSHVNKYNCLIEWDAYPGVTPNTIGIKGVVAGGGEKTFKYSLSLFNDGVFVPFYSGTKSVDFSTPIAPSSPSPLSYWAIRAETAETDHVLLNRNEKLSKVLFTTTPRNYDQVVHFNGQNCLIKSQKKSCEITTNKTFIAESDLQGGQNLPFYITDPYDHFEHSPKDFNLSWDFRSPEISRYYVNTQDNRLPMIISDYGSPFVLLPDQVAVVVKSPHALEEGDWWYPTDPTLTLKISSGFEMTNTVTYADRPVTFNLNLRNPNSVYTSAPIEKPILLQDNLIYTYDFKTIQDGLYDFTISTKDINNNGSEEVIKDVYIDRLPPDLQFVLNNKQFIGQTGSIYSMSDLTALAWGGWQDGTEIFEATINGEPVNFVGGLDNIKRIANVDLPLNSTNTLVVKARDTTGNEVFKELKFKYAQYTFNHQAKETMKLIEPAKISLLQTQGLRCIYATSPDLAAIYSADPRFRGCTIHWLSIPNGMLPVLPTSRLLNYQNIAQGILSAEGSFPYKFVITAHDNFGDSLNIYTGEGSLDIQAIQAPTLIAGNPHIVNNFGDDYINTKSVNRPLIFPYRIEKSRNANVTVQVFDGNGQVVFEKLHDRPGDLILSQVIANGLQEAPLSLSNFKVRAFYSFAPDVYIEKPYNFFNTPPSDVRLYTNHERTLLENTQFQIFANISQLQNGVLAYAPEMGQWEVYLAKFENGMYVPVTSKNLIDETGQTSFTLDSDSISNNTKLHTIADLVTSYSDVSVRLVSNSLMSVNVLRLSAINAQLTTPEVRLPIPANFLIKADFQEHIDRMSTRQTLWQVSEDGSNWTQSSAGSTLSHKLTMTAPGSLYVRAAMEHVLTKEFTYTNALKVTGYQEASISLTGHTRVVAGALSDYHHTMTEFASQQAVGDVEWSLDDQATWIKMAPSERIAIPADKIITARLLVKHDDEQEPNYYVYDSINVKAIAPEQLRPIVSRSGHKLEIGETVTFKAKFRPQSYYAEDLIRYAFISPNGEKVNETVLTHTLTTSDFVNGSANFRFKAWVDGLAEQTMTTVDLPITQNVYEFPRSAMQFASTSRVINAPFVASVSANTSSAPSNVKFETEWLLPPEVELIKSYSGNRSVSIRIIKSGLHNIKSVFTDNRGNRKEHSIFIEAVDPPPMRVELIGSASNEFMRPPLYYTLRSKVWPGDNRDFVTKYNWSLNGSAIDGDTAFMKRFEFTEPGEYDLTLLTETHHGQTHTETVKIKVVPNKAPTCEPFTELRSNTLIVHANCSDVDGKITQIHYNFDDYAGVNRTMQSYSQLLLFQAIQYPSVSVNITAFDDSGASVNSVVHYAGN